MNQFAGPSSGAAGTVGAIYSPPKEQSKGTAVDSVNANIESLTNRVETLARFAARISDGILGVAPEQSTNGSAGPRPVTQSTQDHMRDLEAAFERLSAQINRLG